MRRKGFSLIEAAIVLGVVGLIIGSIWIAAASVRENMLANQITSGYLHIVSEMQSRVPISLATGRNCSNNGRILQDEYSYSSGVLMGLFPADWVKSNNKAYLPTGQVMRITVCYDDLETFIARGSINFFGEGKFSASLCLKVLPQLMNMNKDFRFSVSGIAAYVNDPSTHTAAWMNTMCMANGAASVSTFTVSFPLTANF